MKNNYKPQRKLNVIYAYKHTYILHTHLCIVFMHTYTLSSVSAYLVQDDEEHAHPRSLEVARQIGQAILGVLLVKVPVFKVRDAKVISLRCS